MLVPVLLFIVGLLFLIKGGDWFVDGASALARRFHLPELLIGATVVSIGTTLPEVMVSTMSAVSGHGEIAYGNAIGSVICNSALIAAITIAVRPGKVDPKTLRVPVAFFFAAAAIYCVAAYAMGEFTRPLGFVMLAMFVAYMVANVLQMKKAPAAAEAEAEAENAGEEMSLTKTLVLLVLGAVLIALGANLLVDNGTLIAQALGVPESVIALTFVALGCLHRIYTDSGPAPTCTAGATHSRTCARCGADLGTVELPPNGHTYSETVQTAPTCTATGRSNYTCTVCGDSYTADTPALGHNWVQRAYTAPTCCVAGREQRYCARCGTEETNILSPTQPEGHFVKGTVTDKAGAPLANISVSLDGTPVAVTNENGVFLFEGVPCGNYTLTFCGDGCVPRRVPLSVSGGNTTAPAAVLLLVGDLNGDGYVNARDDVLAQRQAVSPSDGANLSVNRVLPKVTLDRIYGVQAKIGVLYIRQSAEEDGAYRRQFEVNVRAFNEYRVVDCGFLYGKNMAETDLVPERVGATNAQGYAVKRMPAACTPGRKVLLYGSSSATGQVSARFYITYTNGVMTKTYLSEVCTYDYDEA